MYIYRDIYIYIHSSILSGIYIAAIGWDDKGRDNTQ